MKEFFEEDKYEEHKETFLNAKEWNKQEQVRTKDDKTITDFN